MIRSIFSVDLHMNEYHSTSATPFWQQYKSQPHWWEGQNSEGTPPLWSRTIGCYLNPLSSIESSLLSRSTFREAGLSVSKHWHKCTCALVALNYSSSKIEYPEAWFSRSQEEIPQHPWPIELDNGLYSDQVIWCRLWCVNQRMVFKRGKMCSWVGDSVWIQPWNTSGCRDGGRFPWCRREDVTELDMAEGDGEVFPGAHAEQNWAEFPQAKQEFAVA